MGATKRASLTFGVHVRECKQMSALGDADMDKFLDRSSTLLISTKNAKTRLNSGSFSFVYEKCTNYLILLRIETARSSSFGYKCAYVFQVVSIFE